jgi:hypothetical protein
MKQHKCVYYNYHDRKGLITHNKEESTIHNLFSVFCKESGMSSVLIKFLWVSASLVKRMANYHES